jgi:RHS repeat-associated protein
MPWGETRFTSGYQPSDYLYTGQRAESGIGLYYYNARWYDPYLSRFTQADTIVTGGIQGFDRYSYVSNNPIRNIDPSGHLCIDYDIFGHVQTLCTDSSREETRGREPNGPNQFRNPSYWNKWELPSPAKVSSITSESNNSIIKSQICSNYAPGTNPICYSQSMPDTTDLQITLFGYFYDYSETALNIRIPVISIPIDIVAQINRDKDQGYSDFQMAVRSILVAGEGQLASVVSSLSGGTTLILTGENVPIAIGTYIITSVSISSLFNTINEGSIFPLLHLTKQEDIKSYSN